MQRLEEGGGCPRVGVTGGCELPIIGTENKLQSSEKAESALNHVVIFPAPY